MSTSTDNAAPLKGPFRQGEELKLSVYDVDGKYLLTATDIPTAARIVAALNATERPADANVQAVIDKHRERAAFGMAKYGVDTMRGDVGMIGWLQHLQHELMDGAIYAERLMRDAAVAHLEPPSQALFLVLTILLALVNDDMECSAKGGALVRTLVWVKCLESKPGPTK